jgi:hypothetical protein
MARRVLPTMLKLGSLRHHAVGSHFGALDPVLVGIVLLRDEGCRVPGCTVTQHIEVDHVIHWEDDGPTDTGTSSHCARGITACTTAASSASPVTPTRPTGSPSQSSRPSDRHHRGETAAPRGTTDCTHRGVRTPCRRTPRPTVAALQPAGRTPHHRLAQPPPQPAQRQLSRRPPVVPIGLRETATPTTHQEARR